MINEYRTSTTITSLLEWVDLPSSSYYYVPKKGKRGKKASTHTQKRDGTLVPNTTVVEEIKEVLQEEFCCYGYHTMTSQLRDLEYIINHKKVYRLMDENKLLFGKVIRTSGKRTFVKHRKIVSTARMEYLSIDIKYVWVAGERRNYYLLTVIDVYTRLVLRQIFQSSIRKADVINLMRHIQLQHGIKGVTIRNDNGSQFIANDVKLFLKKNDVNQEFTHVATPEENAYIEAFHSIVQREVIDRFEFSSYYDAKITFEKHLHWYNNVRKHGRLKKKTPMQMWILAQNTTFVKSEEAETSNAGEQLDRNTLMNENENEEYNPTPHLLK